MLIRKMRAYWRLLIYDFDARRNVLPWRQPGAVAALRWELGLATVFGAALFTLGGYHVAFHLVNSIWAQIPDWLAVCITHSGDALFALTLLLLAAKRFPQVIWLAMPSIVIATVLSSGLKMLFDAARPGAVLPAGSFHLIFSPYLARSFPSGHTVTAFVALGTLAWLLPRNWMRWCAFALALLVGLSRVGVGAHWPIDVVAGAGVGTLAVLLGAPLAQRWQQWGLSSPAHFLIVAALTACALALALLHRPEYQLTMVLLWVRGVALLALILTVWDYLISPAVRTAHHQSSSELQKF